MEDRLTRAADLYEQAIFQGETAGLNEATHELDALEADLCLSRGRIRHGQTLAHPTDTDDTDPAGAGDPAEELAFFERAAELYRSLGDRRGEGEALLWTGLYHQVIAHDQATAVPALERAGELARSTNDRLTLSYVLRHLGIAAHQTGDLATARAHLEESTRLRRELDFRPGVAANLVGLAYLAAAQHRPDDARAILAEATELATATSARRILTQIDEARADLQLPER